MLRLFHDYISPASALAVLRVHELLDEGLTVEFVGVDLLGLTRPVPPTATLREQLAQHREALWSLGLEAVGPHLQPPTLVAHVVGDLAAAHGCGRAWREVCYRLYWERGADLSDRQVLLAAAARLGLPGDAVVAALTGDEAREAVRRRSTGQRVRGVTTVPLLEVEGSLMSALVDPDQLRRLADRAQQDHP